jgi:hypothetical protein
LIGAIGDELIAVKKLARSADGSDELMAHHRLLLAVPRKGVAMIAATHKDPEDVKLYTR